MSSSKAVTGTKGAQPANSVDKTEHRYAVRKISNGHIVKHTTDGPDSWKEEETYYPNKPTVAIGPAAPAVAANPAKPAPVSNKTPAGRSGVTGKQGVVKK